MKLVFSFFAFFIAITTMAQELASAPMADEVLRPVYQKAAYENKNILLIFHASWCGWCRKMDTSLQDKAIQPLIDKMYVITHLTVYETPAKQHLENKGALQLLTKEGGADKGLPYWYILDKEGRVLGDSQIKPGQNVGCPATEEEVGYFINVLKKTSSLTEEELTVIKKRFRKNE